MELAPSKEIDDNSPAFSFSSYNENDRNEKKKYMKFPDKIEDFDHTWNFVTFTYSYVKKKSVAFVRFGHS